MSKKAFPEEITVSEREEILLFLEDRFGFPKELFEEYIFFKSAINYWMFPKTEHLYQIKKLTPEVLGLLFLRRVSRYLKPTSTFIQRFGRFAKRNIVTLNREMLSFLKEEKKIEIDLPLSPGYVIIKDENWFLGCGLYIPRKLFLYLEEKLLHNLLH